MKIAKHAVDSVILRELGRRVAHMRLDRNITQAELAAQSGTGKRTLERLEAGAVATQMTSFIRVCRMLSLVENFDLLIPEPLPSPIALLKLKGKKRRRASMKKATGPSKKWTWRE